MESFSRYDVWYKVTTKQEYLVGSQNFIEINGRRYDAGSGKLIHESTQMPPKTSSASKPVVNNKGVMDGVAKRPTKNSSHTAASHIHKSPQKSQTLMRSSVHKPTEVIHRPVTKVSMIQKSQLGDSARRQSQASTIVKSPLIKKFGPNVARSSVARSHQETIIKPGPGRADKQTTNPSTRNTPVVSESRKVSVTEKLINAALASSRSHEELPVHFKRHSKLSRKLGVSTRAAGVSMAVLAGVLLGGFFAVQRVPNLAMKVAATRAGFNASMPGYSPSGFSFRGPINYTAGRVTVSYRSNSDDRNYSVSQSSSNWNSDALLSNFVVANNKTYQTYLDRGRTLYMYDGSSATWIDNGVWYQIEGDSSLTTDQLIRIASSL